MAMAGESYIQVHVKAPDALIPAIQQAIANVTTAEPQRRDSEWRFEEGAVWVNDANEVADALDALMISGSEDHFIQPTPFAYRVWTDPDLESLGFLRISAPGPNGQLNFFQECDQHGSARPHAHDVVKVMRTAASLEVARVQIEEMTGSAVCDAYDAYVVAATPADIAADCPVCEGSGEDPDDPELECDNCRQTGRANIPYYDEKRETFIIPDN